MFNTNKTSFVNSQYFDSHFLESLKQKFITSGYLRLENFIAAEAYNLLLKEISFLEQLAIKKIFIMELYDTPRNLSVIGGSKIMENSPLLLNLYRNHELKDVVETIVNENLFECKHPEEFISINFLLKRGTNHGWHLDDPPYALVIFLEAPSCYNDGGLLEFIPNWKNFCETINLHPYKDIHQAIKEAQKLGYIHQYQHKTQDAYILRADKNLHRVTELNTDQCKRIVINLGWENRDKVEYGDTASLLYNSNNSDKKDLA